MYFRFIDWQINKLIYTAKRQNILNKSKTKLLIIFFNLLILHKIKVTLKLKQLLFVLIILIISFIFLYQRFLHFEIAEIL